MTNEIQPDSLDQTTLDGVREGGEVLQTIELDRGCFACALRGADMRTLFMVATEWRGPMHMADEPRTGQILTIQATVPGVKGSRRF